MRRHHTIVIAAIAVLVLAGLAGLAIARPGADGQAAAEDAPSPPDFRLDPGLSRAVAERVREQAIAAQQLQDYVEAVEAQQIADFVAAVEAQQAAEYLTALETKAREEAAAQAAERRAQAAPAVSDGSVWDRLARCESGGNWAMNSGNGFYGGIQFMRSTWLAMGGGQYADYPHLASREQQIAVAERLLAQSGWGQWPACSARLGLR